MRRPGNRFFVLSETVGVASDHSLGSFPGGFSGAPNGKRRPHETADQPLARCFGNPPEEWVEGLNFWGRRVGTRAVVAVVLLCKPDRKVSPKRDVCRTMFIGDDKWTDLRKRKWSPI